MEYHSAVAELKPTAKIMLILDLAHERNLDLKTEEGRQHIQSERMAAELVVIFPAILRMLDAGLTVAARVTRSKSIRLKKEHLTEDWWLAFIEEGHRAVKSAHPLGAVRDKADITYYEAKTYEDDEGENYEYKEENRRRERN
jgi:hypothetical protein